MSETPTVNTSVRIDRELHNRLAAEAERQDRSIAYLINKYIRVGLAQDEPRAAEEGGQPA
jgi:predicted HicB family RNase H-like nuclease